MLCLLRLKKEHHHRPNKLRRNMKNLRKLGAAVALTIVMGLSAFAGQIDTPPCPIPEPGQIETPPCAAASGDMNTSEATSTASVYVGTSTLANNDTSLGDIATAAVLNFLSLY
jgi:hypothetical protein